MLFSSDPLGFEHSESMQWTSNIHNHPSASPPVLTEWIGCPHLISGSDCNWFIQECAPDTN